jgi:alkanesulfonate monooxygenase SsuD/methylene tetrahydromethanopterin reductase-like flavin-dependent oxidoreductase (luciferase family)
MRRTARLGNGWYPIASNPQFPMGAPQQLQAGLERLRAFCEAEGRDPAELDIVYRSHTMHLTPNRPAGERSPFVGNADDLAADIRQYEAMGVTHLIVDFLRSSNDLDTCLRNMEDFATQVWPRV